MTQRYAAYNDSLWIKKQNLENFTPTAGRRGIFSFGSGFALFTEQTQQAAEYSAL
jgi:hypothetical protein